MKRLAIVLLVVATAMAVALPAGAKKPDGPPGKPTTTTQPPEPLAACADHVTFEGERRGGFQCLWTPEAGDAETATIAVTYTNPLRHLVVFVRDADPGDICVLEQEWDDQPGPTLAASFPLADERGSYWGYTNPDDGQWYVGEHWCEPYDPVVGQRADPNGEPLHVSVSFRAPRGTDVTVTLDPGQVGS